MGYQTVRALTPVRHNGVLRIPGQTTGDNAQDFVAEDSQVAKLVALGVVTSLGVASAPPSQVASSTYLGAFASIAALVAQYPAASNEGKNAIAGGVPHDCFGGAWVPRSVLNYAKKARLKKYGATAWDLCLYQSTNIGVTALTHSLEADYPRFSTTTRKCVCSAAVSQIRFQNISALADPDDQLLTIDVYLPTHPDEFGQTRYPVATNPSIDIRICNTTSGSADSWTFSFSSTYLRQGWNTLKMWAGDTIGGTGVTGLGTLATGAGRSVAGAGISFLSAVQFCEITFNNMAGQSVYVDQLRRGAKANSKMVIGFDASGSAYNDNTFIDKVAPLFALYGQTGYTTMTNVYEMLFSGGQSWERQKVLHDVWGWDVLNHTWGHGGTTVGRNQTVTAVRTGGNLVTVSATAAHGLPVGLTFWSSIRGAQDATVNGVFKITISSANNMTYTSAGADGAVLGTITWCTFMSEVFSQSTADLINLLAHELVDMAKTLRGVGYHRAIHTIAYPNNSVPELGMLQTAAASAGIKLGRGYRGGTVKINEFGIDNPLHFGSLEMGSGAGATTVTQLKDKVLGAIARGEDVWVFGHYALDETTLGVPVDLEYPPGSGGNPAPPAAGVSGTGGWWYVGSIGRFLAEAVGPSIAAGNLELMTPRAYEDFMGVSA